MTDIELSTATPSDMFIYIVLLTCMMGVAVIALHVYIIPMVRRAYIKAQVSLYWALRNNHESTSWGFGPCEGYRGRGYTRHNK